jgi:DNA mismatch endonuclease (patch repair protein)
LTREAGAKNVVSRYVRQRNLTNITLSGHLEIFCVQFSQIGVFLHCHHAAMTKSLQSDVEATQTREKVYETQLCHTGLPLPHTLSALTSSASNFPISVNSMCPDGVITREARSRIMSAIRKTNTKPELAVRRFLHRLGFRYRLHVKDLPGRPDIVLPRYRTVVLVHGRFWHRCPHCAAGQKLPRSNIDYWLPKLARNQARDMEVHQALEVVGWNVLTIWSARQRPPPNSIALRPNSRRSITCVLARAITRQSRVRPPP